MHTILYAILIIAGILYLPKTIQLYREFFFR